ncbi:MAG: FAD-dependent pyridine nucleotide-disulfide oxidoreductase [Frankiales bacterium]|nr:FAD-dependent pyridine nucleotide-disulfide oxidoreductase [Frankiales bacterium]
MTQASGRPPRSERATQRRPDPCSPTRRSGDATQSPHGDGVGLAFRVTVPPRPNVQPLDVLVIGAGQAGLALAWHLKRAGARFLVIDAGSRVGDAWRSRWDSLRLFSAAEYDSLPGLPFPAPAGTYPTKDLVADYLEDYARSMGLPVLLRIRVTRLQKSAEGFTAESTGGTFIARQVVVATGGYASPHVPRDLARGLGPEVVQLHSAEYRRASDLPGGPVLVVGAGNSGVQIAQELASSGQRVSLAVGARPYMVPQRPLGRDLFWWLTTLGLATRPSGDGLPRRPGFRRLVMDGTWRRLSAALPRARRRAATTSESRVELVIGTTWHRLHSSGVSLRPRAVTASGATFYFADGSSLCVSAVVWATGFRPDYSWLEVPGVIVDKQVVHAEGLSPVPGLAFLGLPWQRSRSSAWLGFVSEDAAWLAERLHWGVPVPRRASPRIRTSRRVRRDRGAGVRSNAGPSDRASRGDGVDLRL